MTSGAISNESLVGAYVPVTAAGEIDATLPGVRPAAHPRLQWLRSALITMRPRQWVKNALVVAAAGAAGALGHDHVSLRLGLAFAAFCLLASGIYAVNDVRDAHEDRLHPRKRHRPVAAGALTPQAALAFGIALIVGGLVVCVLVRPALAVVGSAYILLTLSYTLVWRRLVILDLFAIAGGFVLRAVAGGVAAPVALSRWFIVVVTATAVLVAAGKRHAELRRSLKAGQPRRRVLERYTPQLLTWILGSSAAVAFVAYCMWALKLPAVDGVPWRLMTVVPFALCLARYGALVRWGAGEAPEELVLSDRWLAFSGSAWVVLFSLSVAAG